MSAETVRIEEYSGIIQNRLICVWTTPEQQTPWLPTEFLPQYVTRILIVGRTATISTGLAADPHWTQVWRSPGGKEWACLLGTLQHMPRPLLITLGPDVTLSAKLVSNLRAVCGAATVGQTSVIVIRQPGQAPWVGEPADQVFFPILTAPTAGLQEWAARTAPRAMDFKTLLPQLAEKQYALTAAEGAWYWYRPAESGGIATLTIQQIAQQIRMLGKLLEATGL